jgi:signal transduction histidine kinase
MRHRAILQYAAGLAMLAIGSSTTHARPIEGAVCEVRDQGPGIPADRRERIFERFAQAGLGTEQGGLGVGLWIVREIVARLEGEIAVESEPGAGACFLISLPFDPEDDRP